VSLISELKRRRVFKVAAVYAITAWLLVQIVTSIKAPLNLPDWSDTLVIVLLGIGFPVALILSWAFDLTPEGIRATGSDSSAAVQSAAPHWLNFGIQGLVLLAVGFLLFDQYLGAEDATGAGPAVGTASLLQGSAERLSIVTPPNRAILLAGSPNNAVAISPDGQTVAYVSRPRPGSGNNGGDNRQGIAIRRLGARTTELLASSGEARFQPFFSPDGRWIGFFTDDGQMRKMLLGSHSDPITIIDGIEGPQWSFALWHENGNIYYWTPRSPTMFSVSAEGGTPTPILEPDPLNPEYGFVPTDFIPGTDIILFTSAVQRGDRFFPDLEALDLASGERTLVAENFAFAGLLASGHLVFSREGVILAATFDVTTLALTSPAVPLADNALLDSLNLVPQLAVSRSGTLAYIPEADSGGRLVLVDRDGSVTSLGQPIRNYRHVSVAGSGSRAAISVTTLTGPEVHIYDFAGRSMRVLTERGYDESPEFRPDGESLALLTAKAEARGLVERSLAGPERMLIPVDVDINSRTFVRNVSWHPTEDLLAFTHQAAGEHDIWIARLTDSRIVTEPLIDSTANEFSPRFSADGNWLAYFSAGRGSANIYIRGWPDGEPIAIRPGGGAANPRWSKTGSELFFSAVENGLPTLFSIEVSGTGDQPVLGEPEPLFATRTPNADGSATVLVVSGGNTGAGYDVLPDGRFLMVEQENVAQPQEVAITRNWLAEIEGL